MTPVEQKKDDPGRVNETLGISHARPNRLNQRYQTARVTRRSKAGIRWQNRHTEPIQRHGNESDLNLLS
jgi:hypothetical protein